MRDLDPLMFICADCGQPCEATTEEDAAEQHDLGRPGHDFIAVPPENVDTPDSLRR